MKLIKDEWETPTWLFYKLHQEFHFNLDVAATMENSKCLKYFTKEDNALMQKWDGRCFMNPPYSRGNIDQFVRKAAVEIVTNSLCEVIVGVLPVRTSTNWFHNWVYNKAELRFLHKRVKFVFNGVQATAGDFYATMVVIWKK